MTKKIFVIAFLLACVFQILCWTTTVVIDGTMWADQALFVETGNPKEFDVYQAYGHPGGPLIEGTIALHRFGISYYDSLIALLIVLDSVLIAGASTLCFLLKKDELWWVATLIVLSFHRLYNNSTPPSTLASLLTVFVCLLTIFIYERRDSLPKSALALWSIAIGLIVATRFDIGTIVAAFCSAILLPALPFRKMVTAIGGSIVVFFAADPFMWFMPVQHVYDLVSKILFVYGDFDKVRLPLDRLIEISLLSLISILLIIIFSFWRKILTPPLPLRAIVPFLIMTVGLYGVFLSSDFQAVRYFLPLIFLWEAILPLSIARLIDGIRFDFVASEEGRLRGLRWMKIAVIAMLFVYPVLLYIIIL